MKLKMKLTSNDSNEQSIFRCTVFWLQTAQRDTVATLFGMQFPIGVDDVHAKLSLNTFLCIAGFGQIVCLVGAMSDMQEILCGDLIASKEIAARVWDVWHLMTTAIAARTTHESCLAIQATHQHNVGGHAACMQRCSNLKWANKIIQIALKKSHIRQLKTVNAYLGSHQWLLFVFEQINDTLWQFVCE